MLFRSTAGKRGQPKSAATAPAPPNDVIANTFDEYARFLADSKTEDFQDLQGKYILGYRILNSEDEGKAVFTAAELDAGEVPANPLGIQHVMLYKEAVSRGVHPLGIAEAKTSRVNVTRDDGNVESQNVLRFVKPDTPVVFCNYIGVPLLKLPALLKPHKLSMVTKLGGKDPKRSRPSFDITIGKGIRRTTLTPI